LPHDGVSRQCRLFRQVAPLVSRHATRQGVPPHHLAKADRPIPYRILGSHTSDVPLVSRSYSTFTTRPSGSGDSANCFVHKTIRVGTLSHDARISFCFFTVFPTIPSAFQLSYYVGTNLRRRSDTVLDQPLVDKIHTPSANLSKLAVGWVIVTSPFRNTHFSQMYSFRMAMPNPMTAGCSRLTLNLYQLLFTKRYSEDHS